MGNPWEEIKLDDYENHMSLESVYQLQVLNGMMKEQFVAYDVACIIQINTGSSFVSDSPYLHAFDCLETVHHQIEEETLGNSMFRIGYQQCERLEQDLPNGKRFVRLDFVRQCL